MEILDDIKNSVDKFIHKIRKPTQPAEDISEILEHVGYNEEQLGREK